MNGQEMEAYELIETCCRNIKSGGLIFSNKNILKFLVAASKNRIVVEKFRLCNDYASYAEVYRSAENYLPTGNMFVLPKNAKKMVVLATGLLYEFDKKSISINKFLKDFYPAKSVSESFSLFCNHVLSRYVIAFRDVLENNYVDEEEIEHEKRKIISEDKDYKMVNDVIKEQVNPIIETLIQTITEDDSINEIEKSDCLEIVDGLAYAIESFNSKIIKTIWLSFKKASANVKSIQSYIGIIDDIFMKYAVLD